MIALAIFVACSRWLRENFPVWDCSAEPYSGLWTRRGLCSGNIDSRIHRSRTQRDVQYKTVSVIIRTTRNHTLDTCIVSKNIKSSEPQKVTLQFGALNNGTAPVALGVKGQDISDQAGSVCRGFSQVFPSFCVQQIQMVLSYFLKYSYQRAGALASSSYHCTYLIFSPGSVVRSLPFLRLPLTISLRLAYQDAIFRQCRFPLPS